MKTTEFGRMRAEGRLPSVSHSDTKKGYHGPHDGDSGRTPPEAELMTIEEFAAWLRISNMAARSMIRREQLPKGAVVRIGRRVRIRTEIVRTWVFGADVA